MTNPQKRLYATTAIVILSFDGCSPNDISVASPPAPAVVHSHDKLPVQARIDLGVVVQGQSAKLNSWITNQSQEFVEVSNIPSSCECLAVELSKMRIGPGERTLAILNFDGAKEPDFVGSLQIEVELTNDKGIKVGQIDIPVDVIRAEANLQTTE